MMSSDEESVGSQHFKRKPKSKRDVHEISPSINEHDKSLDQSDYEQDILFKEKVAKGEAISDKYLKFVNNIFGQELDSDHVNEIKERFPEPENTELLSGKHVNPEINRVVPKYAKRRDYLLKMVQHNVGVTATSGLKALDDIKTSKVIPKNEKSKICKSVCDTIVMSAKVMDDLSIMRRHLIKPYLNKKYASLASQKTYDKFLFGSNLPKSLKEAEDYSHATKDLGKTYQQNSYTQNSYQSGYRPYGNRGSNNRGGYQRGYNNYSRPFLPRGRGQYRRGPQNQYQPQYNSQNKFQKKKE